MMLAMSAHPFGHRAYATRLGEVADFRIDALQRTTRRPNSFLERFFCRHQAQDLRQIRRLLNLTIGEARQHSRYVLRCARPMIDSHCYRRRNASNLLCRGVARIIVYAMLRQPI